MDLDVADAWHVRACRGKASLNAATLRCRTLKRPISAPNVAYDATMLLSALLPGLRDVRLPLAVGFTWLLAGWFLFHDELQHAIRSTSLGQAALDLHNFIGPAASLSVVAFAAYLIGILMASSVLRDVPLELLKHGNYWSRGGRLRKAFNLLDDGRRDSLEAFVTDKLTEVTADEPAKLSLVAERFRTAYVNKSQLVRFIMERVVSDQSALADQFKSRGLREDSTREFDEYDRLHAESEFRQAIAFPLLGNVVILAITQSAWLTLVVLPVVLLWFFGVRLGQAARSFLITRVIDGQLNSGTLARIRL